MGPGNWSYSTIALDRRLCDSEVSCIVHTEHSSAVIAMLGKKRVGER